MAFREVRNINTSVLQDEMQDTLPPLTPAAEAGIKIRTKKRETRL